ncbi:MAG: P-II family nitrogen regulator [Halothiobacillaceae bacterium]|jgi:nitrogen regulatory protein P-II 1|nr:P-II family nitrogen regulator [Halothiobacillaceae bacterium]MDY0049809.1 P-II family nitrogen regulator [Halothiobacillaceae bacterium]
MKEIKAIIQPHRLPKIRAAFRHVRGFPGMTVTKVEGAGANDRREVRNIKDELTDYTPKVRIEIICPNDMVEGMLQVLVEVGHTGNVGDGLVWVTPVERLIKLTEQITVMDEDEAEPG